jgi:hypothetical protein
VVIDRPGYLHFQAYDLHRTRLANAVNAQIKPWHITGQSHVFDIHYNIVTQMKTTSWGMLMV